MMSMPFGIASAIFAFISIGSAFAGLGMSLLCKDDRTRSAYEGYLLFGVMGGLLSYLVCMIVGSYLAHH